MGEGSSDRDAGANGSAMAGPGALATPGVVRQMLDTVPLALIVVDQSGIVRAFSRQAEEMFGFAESEVVGQNVRILTPPHVIDRHDESMDAFARTGRSRIIGANRVEMARHRAGHQFPIEIKVNEITLEDGPGYIGYLRANSNGDLQEREPRAMLAELAQASRVSAMGALATAIAHELNQPLTNIANYTQGLCNLVERQDDFKGRDEVIRVLHLCSNQAVRAGQLIHRLRDFVKGGKPHSAPNAVTEIIRDATALAMINGYKRAVHIDYDIPADLPPALVDHLQGQQVVFNLLRNAIEATDTEKGGQHEILISARQLDEARIEISIEDEGPGIDPAIANSLFDSFVTTKGGGMGVGLAICKQIIEANGGQISAGRSERLGGAAFRFTLPIYSNGQERQD